MSLLDQIFPLLATPGTLALPANIEKLHRTLPTDLDIDGLNPITCQAIILHCRGLSRNEICKILNRSTAWHQKQFSTPAVKSAMADSKNLISSKGLTIGSLPS